MTTPTLIVFSHLRWGYVRQRPQHLMARLAGRWRVLFVEEPVRCDGPARLDRIAVAEHVEVLCPRTPVDAIGFHDDQLPLVGPLLAEFLREQAIDGHVAWLYTPMALPLATALAPRTTVYDCMGEPSAQDGVPRQWRQRETALLRMAQLVFTSGPALYEAKREGHPRVRCLPGGVDAAHFAPSALARDDDEVRAAARLHASLPRPRLGWFGVVDERMDLALLDHLARARPSWQLVMAGPVAKQFDRSRLPLGPNIHWLGMQPYSRLPQLVQQWDVCLMPFALNEATRFINPAKALEYMAAEKPVVSTPVHDVVALYGDVVRIGRDAAGFVAACDAALAECGDKRSRRIGEMLALVSRSSWDHCADTVHRLLVAELARAPATAPRLAAPAPPPARHAVAGG